VTWINYIVSTLVGSLAGFVVGFLVGHVNRVADLVQEVVVGDDTHGPETKSGTSHRWWDKSLSYFVLVLAVTSVILNTLLGLQVKHQNNCQVRYNTAVVGTITERARFGDRDRDAIDALVSDVASAKSVEDSVNALRRYQTARQRVDADRARHPFPSLPDC
jgi:hypothetical protein